MFDDNEFYIPSNQMGMNVRVRAPVIVCFKVFPKNHNG